MRDCIDGESVGVNQQQDCQRLRGLSISYLNRLSGIGLLNQLHIGFGGGHIVAYIGGTSEAGFRLLDDTLYLFGHNRIRILAAEHHKVSRTEYIVAIVSDEACLQLFKGGV